MALTTSEEALVRQLLDQQAAILSLAGNEATITSKLGATKVTLADLTAASVIDDADLLLIRQGTTEKSVAGSVVKSLVSQPDASETVKGIIELATSAETITGTDNSRAVHPAGLASLTATETRSGLIELATAAEAQALTDAVRALSPARLASAFGGSNQSLAASGYQKLPSGLIVQWGIYTATGSTSGTISMPLTFPNVCAGVFTTPDGTNGGLYGIAVYSRGASSFSFRRRNITVSNVADDTSIAFVWFAIGY